MFPAVRLTPTQSTAQYRRDPVLSPSGATLAPCPHYFTSVGCEGAAELDLDAVPGEASVRKFSYPRTPLGAGLFRVRPGPFVRPDLSDGAFAQFADAHTLQQFNTLLVTRDIRRAQPGDLLFYRQLEQDLPFHAMVYLGRSNFDSSPANWIVYHTGPLGGSPGEIRRPTVEELLRHPSPRWRPNTGNGN